MNKQFYPWIWKSIAGLLGIYVLSRFYYRWKKHVSHQCYIKEHGCESASKISERHPFGLGLFLDEIKHFRSHTSLENYRNRFQALDSMTFFGRFLWLDFFFTSEPENIKSILATDFKSYSVGERRKKALSHLLGEGIFTTDGAAWQHSRELLRPCFARSQIGDRELFEKHFQNFLRAIPRDGSTVDLQSLFFKLTLDIATEFLFGVSTYTLDEEKTHPEDEEFVRAFNYAQNPLESKSALALLLPDRRFQRSCKYVHDWIDELVERALVKNPWNAQLSKANKSTTRYVLLHELASQTSNKIRIRTELLNTLLAGRDTTASLLSNAWLSISKDPRIWTRLQQEIGALETPLGENRPLFEELKDMKYLRATLNESLRVHPVVPVNSRQAIADTTLPLGGGRDGKSPVFVPKGTVVNYGVHAMHHREDLFGEDHDEFKPERWLDEGGKKGLRVGWEYLPFNGGPRICIGQQFALTEASFVSVRLLQEFACIESRDPEPWREKLSLTCTSLNGCKVSLTRRV